MERTSLYHVTEDDTPDFEYDRLRLSFITTNVLNLKTHLNNVEIDFKQCGQLGQAPQPGWLWLYKLGHLTSLAHSQGFIKCYTKG